MTTFTAQYASGTCVDCDARIQPGEEISKNLTGDYSHVECPAAELDLAAAKPVCPRCQMVTPCFCE